MKEQRPMRFEDNYTRGADRRAFRYQLEVLPWQIRASVFEGNIPVFEGLKIETFVSGGVLSDADREVQARRWVESRIDSGEGFVK
ncbi:hypothetical protein [Pulveribacter sp.]|uniref:hypothetical protein n=1 Tax=Pulveribacter sp. TaxID=2678893 RepID=UPI00289A94DD|nr:hypothetical protein [Pulveribacter sp.]